MIQGILYIVGSSLVFGCLPTSNRYLVLNGIPPMCVTFYTQGILTLIAAAAARLRGDSLRIDRGSAVKLLLLGAVGMGATSFLINSATQSIPVGLATVIHFMYPTVVTVVMMTVFRQKATWCKLLAVVCSVSGMLLITNLEGGSVSLLGVLLAASSSLTYSYYMISNEKAGFVSLPLLTRLFYAGIGSTAVFGVLSALSGNIRVPTKPGVLAVLFLISGAGNFIAHFLITKGTKLIGASTASFVNMLEPVTSVFVSLIVYHDVLRTNMVLGIVLILSSVLLVALDGKLLEARQAKHAQ